MRPKIFKRRRNGSSNLAYNRLGHQHKLLFKSYFQHATHVDLRHTKRAPHSLSQCPAETRRRWPDFEKPLRTHCSNSFIVRQSQNANLIDCIQLVVNRGMDVAAKDSYNRCALYLLCQYYEGVDFINVARLLTRADMDPKDLKICVKILRVRKLNSDAQLLLKLFRSMCRNEAEWFNDYWIHGSKPERPQRSYLNVPILSLVRPSKVV